MAAWPADCAPLEAAAVPGRRVHPRHLAAAAARHHLPAADQAALATGSDCDGFARRRELRYELCSSPLAPERRTVTDTETGGFKVCWNLDGTRITAAPSGDHAVVVRAERLRLPYAERLLRLALESRSAHDPHRRSHRGSRPAPGRGVAATANQRPGCGHHPAHLPHRPAARAARGDHAHRWPGRHRLRTGLPVTPGPGS
ncbi:hypothetical protein GCM10010441_29630 [Kitasatospora paracochleata]